MGFMEDQDDFHDAEEVFADDGFEDALDATSSDEPEPYPLHRYVVGWPPRKSPRPGAPARPRPRHSRSLTQLHARPSTHLVPPSRRAAFENDGPRCRQLMQAMTREEQTRLDVHGNTVCRQRAASRARAAASARAHPQTQTGPALSRRGAARQHQDSVQRCRHRPRHPPPPLLLLLLPRTHRPPHPTCPHLPPPHLPANRRPSSSRRHCTLPPGGDGWTR